MGLMDRNGGLRGQLTERKGLFAKRVVGADLRSSCQAEELGVGLNPFTPFRPEGSMNLTREQVVFGIYLVWKFRLENRSIVIPEALRSFHVVVDLMSRRCRRNDVESMWSIVVIRTF